MPTLRSISKNYAHDSCTISVRGDSDRDTLEGLQPPLACDIVLEVDENAKTFTGDGELLQDIVTTIDRYLANLLKGQPQGTYSGAVAIRPLNAVFHRITVRQGNGIGQADLGMSQLYDLAESLGDIRTAIPHLETLKTPPTQLSWYRQPVVGMAALALVVVGVTVGSVTVLQGGDRSQETAMRENEERMERQVTMDQPHSSAPAAPAAAPPSEVSPEIPDSDGAPEDVGVAQRSLADAPVASSPGEPGNSADAETDAGIANLATVTEEAVAGFRLDAGTLEEIAAQVQMQLSDRWEVPAEVTEALPYTVALSPAGAVLSVEPQSDAAATFQSQTPLSGDATFELPQLESGRTEAIDLEVVLGTDGTVAVSGLPASAQ